ncbi:MAG: hypothetical protein ACTHKL_10715, partial [Streptosporangiaceae bacterium]
SHRRVSRYRPLRRARMFRAGGQTSPGQRPVAPAQPGTWQLPAGSPARGSVQQDSRWPVVDPRAAPIVRAAWPAQAGPSRGLPEAAPGRYQALPGGYGSAAVRAAPKAQAAVRVLTADQLAAGQRRKAAARGKAAAQRTARAREKPAVPWYERAQRTSSAPGQRHCGLLEKILHRQWRAGELPPPQIVLAVDRLAEFPQLIKERLVAGLAAIYLGPGGVPELDDMSSLRGMPLPSGRATWDSCAGAYGDRKVIVGSRPSPTPDVMCHEIGHALDDIDGMAGTWLSDAAEFTVLYSQCQPWMTSDMHRLSGSLGRREFFADAFAAIASGQRPALVEMLGGNTRVALSVMLYFNVRYGI